jgi:hypothetical protein
LGDLLSDEDDFHNKKKKTDVLKSEATESTGKQESRFEPSEFKNKQNRAKVVAELFGLEEEKKQPQKQSQNDRDFSSSWLGLKDPVPAGDKTPEVAKAASKTPEHGNVQLQLYHSQCKCGLDQPYKKASDHSFISDMFTIFYCFMYASNSRVSEKCASICRRYKYFVPESNIGFVALGGLEVSVIA